MFEQFSIATFNKNANFLGEFGDCVGKERVGRGGDAGKRQGEREKGVWRARA